MNGIVLALLIMLVVLVVATVIMRKKNNIKVKRGLAYLIDGIIANVVILLTEILVIMLPDNGTFTGIHLNKLIRLPGSITPVRFIYDQGGIAYYFLSTAASFGMVIGLIVFLILISLLESRKGASSIGKKVMNLKITYPDGQNHGFRGALERNIMKYFPALFYVCIAKVVIRFFIRIGMDLTAIDIIYDLLVVLWILVPLFNKKGHGIHDYVVGSNVVEK